MWFKEIPSDLIEWIKLKPRYLFAIALSTGIYLFSSDKILNFLGFFNEIGIKYRFIIGIFFVVSSVSWIISILLLIKNKVIREYQKRKNMKNLNHREKNILKKYIKTNKKTHYFDSENGVVNGLVKKNILYISSMGGRIPGDIAYNLKEWEWKYLNEHPDLLD